MNVIEREPGDLVKLEELIIAEAKAKQRDRYRIVLLAIQGRMKQEIAELLSVAASTVEVWAYRYRDHGLGALRPRKSLGRTPKLPRDKHESFKQRFTSGPRASDGVCTLRGKDAVRILNEEFGVPYTLNGAYVLLHRLNLSSMKPRPRHEHNDPEAMEAFKQSAPLLSGK